MSVKSERLRRLDTDSGSYLSGKTIGAGVGRFTCGGMERKRKMSVKSERLRRLDTDSGSYLSGKQLAQELGVSCAAVWKGSGKCQ